MIQFFKNIYLAFKEEFDRVRLANKLVADFRAYIKADIQSGIDSYHKHYPKN